MQEKEVAALEMEFVKNDRIKKVNVVKDYWCNAKKGF